MKLVVPSRLDISLSEGVQDGVVYWMPGVGTDQLYVACHAPGVEVGVSASSPQEGMEDVAAHLRAVADELDFHRRNLNRAELGLPPLERER